MLSQILIKKHALYCSVVVVNTIDQLELFSEERLWMNRPRDVCVCVCVGVQPKK